MQTTRFLRGRVVAALWISTLAAGVLFGLTRVGAAAHLLRVFEARTFDYRMAGYRGALVPEGAALDDVVIVDIDEASLAELGQFFRWPRAWHAAIIDSLSAAGAAAIGFDILFPESDRLPAEVVAYHVARVPHAADAARLRALLEDLSSDAEVGAAARRSGRVVFGAQVVDAGTPRATLVPPVKEIADGAADVAHVHILPDIDGIVRRLPVVLQTDRGPVLSLGVRLALLAQGHGAAPVDVVPGTVSGPGWQLPTDAGGELLLDFAGDAGTFLRVSYADVLRGRVPAVLFRDRVVIIGATASGLMDYFSSPTSPHYPGVEVHATAVHDILSGRYLHRQSAAGDAFTLWGMALLAAAAVLFLRPLWAVAACIVAAAGLTVVTFERFAGGGVWAGIVLPVAGWATAAAGASAWRYWTEERSKRAIKQAFGRYLAPQVVEEIAADPAALGLGGDERRVTVGFIDVRDFTTLSEGLRAGQLATFLNDYLSAMTAHILEEAGTVDKYIGDAIMMLFGAPNELEDHAERACRTALAMRRTVAARQADWRGYGLEADLGIGVGLNTGLVSVGNMGSAFRFDYTAMGDSVNLASRLEGLNKVYGTDIILGPETALAVGTTFALRELDLVRVKGKREPVRIYELVDDADVSAGEGASAAGWIELFETGLRHFRGRQWAAARAAFESCRAARGEDGPSSRYIRLVEQLEADPPGDEWDGVSVMEHK